MSRIGRQPVPLPTGVTVTIDGATVVVKGPKGELKQALHPRVAVAEQSGVLVVTVRDPENPDDRALWGLFRNLLCNMVEGVTSGFSKTLDLVGVGYKVSVIGQTVTLNIGFSHPVTVILPSGISVSVDKNSLTVSGCDKQVVGEVAANIRRIRKPEPYKGKGIKYRDEVIRRKAGKAVKAVGK